jgi:hypothetical protein
MFWVGKYKAKLREMSNDNLRQKRDHVRQRRKSCFKAAFTFLVLCLGVIRPPLGGPFVAVGVVGMVLSFATAALDSMKLAIVENELQQRGIRCLSGNPVQKIFVDVNDINGNYRFDDTAKKLTSAEVIHNQLSARYTYVHDGVEHKSYRAWVDSNIEKWVPPEARKKISDRILSFYPVHLQLQARADDATAELRELSGKVAAQAIFLTRKFSKNPIFPSAVASIKALQDFASTHPDLRVCHTLFTFGGDGAETWKFLAEATGLQLNGEGDFKGHILTLKDGRTFETPQAIYALLQTGNFVLKADFDFWQRQQGRGKLVPVSGEPNVLVHFKDDNLYEHVAAAFRIAGDTAETIGIQELIDEDVMVNVDPLEYAEDESAFIRAINRAWKKHGWDMQLPTRSAEYP